MTILNINLLYISHRDLVNHVFPHVWGETPFSKFALKLGQTDRIFQKHLSPSPNRSQLLETLFPKFALKLVQTGRSCHKHLSQVCTKTSQNWSQLPQTPFSKFAIKLVQTSRSFPFAFIFLPQIVHLLRQFTSSNSLMDSFNLPMGFLILGNLKVIVAATIWYNPV